jgi:hypothetical protein
MTDLTIERSHGETYDHDGEFTVYSHGVYERGSVLEGQPKRTYVEGGFGSAEDAHAKYPEAEVVDGSSYLPLNLPDVPPKWFDRDDAGEEW